MKSLAGISESKKFTFGICYILLATGLLWFDKVSGAEWVGATASLAAALVVATAYQDR